MIDGSWTRRGLLIASLTSPALLLAQGHGPIFGLSTPTLGRGAWSLDLAAMSRVLDEQQAAMLRPMLSYGVHEDLQLSASLPMPIYATQGLAPQRVATRMPAVPDVEFTLGWRFQRRRSRGGRRSSFNRRCMCWR